LGAQQLETGVSEYEIESLLGNGRGFYPVQISPYECGLSERQRLYQAKMDRTPRVNKNANQPMESEPQGDIPLSYKNEEGVMKMLPLMGIRRATTKRKKH